MRLNTLWLTAACAALLLGACKAPRPPASDLDDQGSQWVSSWISAQQIPEPRNALPATALEGATLRQVVRASLGGKRLRLRISNVFGDQPLTVGGASIARSTHGDSSEIDADTLQPVTFSAMPSVTIPAGAYVVSDPVDFPIRAVDQLAVSIYFPTSPSRQTGHPGSRATSYVLAGNHLSDVRLPDAMEVVHWYQLSALDVETDSGSNALVVLGDSITDGFGVQPNTNQRWTDYLISRVQDDARLECRLAVLNAGLGGNRILSDGLGPNVLSRFDRDVLSRPGVRHVLLLIGVNDLGTLSQSAPLDRSVMEEQVRHIILALEQMIQRAREHEIQIIGGTILPFGESSYYQPDEQTEAARNAINDWIREPGNFDAFVDFDALMRSPEDHAKLASRFDSGDHLHPSMAGYEAMAEAVPLDLFTEASTSPCAQTR